MRIRLLALLCASLCAPLGACGGGGGGGGGSGLIPAPPPLPPPPPAPPPPPPPPATTGAPSARDREYTRSWGLGFINAESAYARGASGAGVTVAVIDSGVAPSEAVDIGPNLSPRSTDVLSGQRTTSAEDSRHGLYVASIIAAGFNGFGTLGVAHRASILSIRADEAGPCEDGCAFRASDLVTSIDFAIANGARVINLSLGGPDRLGANFEAALARAVDAGVVVVTSAGNRSAESPGFPGRYAVDPRFAGAMIATAAAEPGGGLASFSNRAGVAAQGVLTAPGADIITACDGSTCWRVSGTSFAAPHVAGAAALLLQAFPNLTSRQTVDILLRSARDAGEPGADAVFGRGYLDLARAFSPIGGLSAQTAAATITVAAGAGVAGAAFGDAFSADVWRMTALDGYGRPFDVDGRGLILPAARAGLSDTLIARQEAPAPIRAEAEIAPGLSLGFGQGVSLPPAVAAGNARPPGDLLSLVEGGRTVAAGLDLGGVQITAFSAARARRGGDAQAGAVALSAGAEGWRGSLGLALLAEEAGLLGGRWDIRFAQPPATQSRALTLALAAYPRPDVELTLTVQQARLIRTSLDGPLTVEAPITASAFALGGMWRTDAGDWRLRLEQPLRVESGRFALALPAPGGAYDAALTTRQFSAAPTGREIGLRASWSAAIAPNSEVRLEGRVIAEPGHQRDADPASELVLRGAARF